MHACAANQSSIFGVLFDQWFTLRCEEERAKAELTAALTLGSSTSADIDNVPTSSNSGSIKSSGGSEKDTAANECEERATEYLSKVLAVLPYTDTLLQQTTHHFLMPQEPSVVSCLYRACEQGLVEILVKLVHRFDVTHLQFEVRDCAACVAIEMGDITLCHIQDGETPLIVAYSRGQEEACSLLLDNMLHAHRGSGGNSDGAFEVCIQTAHHVVPS